MCNFYFWLNLPGATSPKFNVSLLRTTELLHLRPPSVKFSPLFTIPRIGALISPTGCLFKVHKIVISASVALNFALRSLFLSILSSFLNIASSLAFVKSDNCFDAGACSDEPAAATAAAVNCFHMTRRKTAGVLFWAFKRSWTFWSLVASIERLNFDYLGIFVLGWCYHGLMRHIFFNVVKYRICHLRRYNLYLFFYIFEFYRKRCRFTIACCFPI